MYVYSRWTLAQARRSELDEFAEQWTDGNARVLQDDAGARIWTRFLDFSEFSESEWERSTTSGGRWDGLMVIPVDEDEQLVGVLAVTQAMAVGLSEETTRLMSVAGMAPEPASYSLSALIGRAAADQGISATSVRLRNDLGEIVLRAERAEDLRAQMNEVVGEPVGVTVDANGVRVTAYGDDSLVFTEPQSARGLVLAVRSMGFARVPRGVVA